MKRLLLLLLSLFLFSTVASAQLSLTAYRDVVLSSTGTPLTTAAITVFLPNTTTKPPGGIFSTALGGSLANPFAVDSLGNYTFYAIPGVYDILISVPGLADTTIEDVHLASSSSFLFTGSTAAPLGCVAGEFYYDTTTGLITLCGTAGISVPGTSILDIASVGRLNNVRKCDSAKYAGADAGIKIVACIADLLSTGGVADARGFEGEQIISATITIPSNVTLLLGAATFTSSVLPVFQVNTGSSIVGVGRGGSAPATRLVTNLTSGSMIKPQNTGVSTDVVSLRDFQLDNTSSANAGVIGIDLIASAHCDVRRVGLNRIEKAIRIGGSGICACYNHFFNVQVVDTATSVHFSTTANQNYWFGGQIVPGGTGRTGFLVDGGSNSFFAPDVESFPTGIAFDINGAGNSFYSPYIESGGTGFKFSSSASQRTTIIGGGNLASLTGPNIDVTALTAKEQEQLWINLRQASGITVYPTVLGASELAITNAHGGLKFVHFVFGSQYVTLQFDVDSGETDDSPARLAVNRLRLINSVPNWGDFLAPTGGTSHEWQLPSATGSIPLLESAQTWTGIQTLTTPVIVVANPLEGVLSNTPRWIFKQVDFGDMTAAATADTFTLWTLPANTMIHDVVGTVVTGWSGGSISAAVCSVGTAAGLANDLALDDDFFTTGTRYELHDATVNGGKGTLLFDVTDKFAPFMLVASGDIEIQCDLTGDNHANATAGQARVYALVSQPLGNTITEAN